jgi:hypothetical protein
VGVSATEVKHNNWDVVPSPTKVRPPYALIEAPHREDVHPPISHRLLEAILLSMPSPTDDESETPFPALNLTSTVFSSHLSPDDAYTTATASASTPHVASHGFGTEGAASSVRVRSRSRSHLRRINSDIVTGAGGGGGGSSGRRRRRGWKKLMWVKQSCTSCQSVFPPSEHSPVEIFTEGRRHHQD